MQNHVSKKLKMFCRDNTLIIIPKSADKKTLKFRVTFVLALIIVSFVIFNINIFCSFVFQICNISHLQQEVMAKTEMNSKLKTEKSLVKPVLEKSYVVEQNQLLQNLQVYERHLDRTPSIWPVYASIVSSFGRRFHPIYKRYITHKGIDLDVDYGTKVRATADGSVCFAGWEEGYGYVIKINHDYGYETCYAHNSQLLVNQGQFIKKGQVISLSGNTGESTGPHLHYEVRINNKPVNPVLFLKD